MTALCLTDGQLYDVLVLSLFTPCVCFQCNELSINTFYDNYLHKLLEMLLQ